MTTVHRFSTAGKTAMWLGCVWMACQGVAGQEPAAALRFRRVFVPPAKIADWPADPDDDFVPVFSEEFERLLKAARQGERGFDGPLAARFTSAHCQLRLLGDDELAGTALLHVEHGNSEATLLELAPCNIAVHAARWEETDSPAVMGADAAGRQQLLVEKSGSLKLDFTLRGHRGPGTREFYVFDLALPRSAANTIEVSLPVGLALSTDRGRLAPPGEAAGDQRSWQLDLGGQNKCQLRLSGGGPADQTAQRAIVRQSTTYDVSERGVELAVQFDLDIRDEPLSRLQISLDDGLRLLAARYGNSTIPFSVKAANGNEGHIAELEFPEPLFGVDKVVRLSALAQTVMDAPWTLPAMSPRNIEWQEGKATLLLPTMLELKQLVTAGCRQSQSSTLPAPVPGESIELQCYEPDASIQVTLGQRAEPVRAESGVSVHLGAGETTGVLVANFHTVDGHRYLLDAEVSPQWTIDSVVSEPSGAVQDWDVELHEFPRRTLHVYLSPPLLPGNPVRLVVTGRRLRSPLGETLGPSDLEIAAFQDARFGERLVQVTADGSFKVRLSGDERLARLDPKRLEAGLTELFPGQPSGLLFRVDENSARLGIALERQSPTFDAQLRVDAAIAGDELRESYRITCPAEVARTERLLVRFSPSRPVPPVWTLASGQQVTAELATGASAGMDGETWAVALPAAAGAEVELRATRSVPFAGRMAVSLLSLPEAAHQTGTVVVHGDDDALLDLTNSRLDPLPLPPESTEATRAAFRYDPAGGVTVDQGPLLSIARLDPQESTPAVYVWELRVQSCSQPGSATLHRATLYIQNNGLEALRVGLPASATPLGMQVAGTSGTPRLDADRRFLLPLPQAARQVTATIDFSTPAGGYSLAPLVELPRIHLEVPLLSQTWTVWAPAEYEWLPASSNGLESSFPVASWPRRVFGGLGRAADDAPFNPFQLDDWYSVVQPADGQRPEAQAVEFLLAGLGQPRTAANAPGVQATWKQLLVHLAAELRRDQGELLIDHLACAQMGIFPHTSPDDGIGQTARERGLDLLQRRNLALLISARTVVLTDLTEAALNGRHRVGDPPCLFLARRNMAGEARMQAARNGSSRHFQPPEVWDTPTAWPWRPRHDAPFNPRDLTGWTVCQFSGDMSEPLRMRAMHRGLAGWITWGLFATVLAIGWRRAGSNIAGWWGFVGMLIAAGLLLPLSVAVLFSGAVWGGLVCLGKALWSGPRRRQTPAAAQQSSVVRKTAITFAAGSVAILAAGGTLAWPQEEAAEKEEPATVYTVLIPERGDPEEQIFYRVPQKFYEQLRRAAAESARIPQGWLITKASYQAELHRETPQKEVSLKELKATLELRIFTAGTVRIPLGDGGGQRPVAALLDGAQTPINWAEDGESFSFSVIEPGEYRLEISLRLQVRQESELSRLSLAIPAVHRATAEVQAPPDMSPPTILAAAGEISLAEGGQRTTAWLGPIARFSLEWREAGANGSIPLWDAEELLWLRVQPGAVVLDARLKVRLASGSLKKFSLQIDPRWRLLAPVPGEAATLRVRGSSDAGELVEVTLPQAVSEQTAVNLRLAPTDASGLGHLRLPLLEPHGPRNIKKFLAVSIESTATAYREPGEPLEMLAVPDFVDRWGPSDTVPQMAYKLPKGPVNWVLATAPVAPKMRVRDSLTNSFGLGRINLRYFAELQHSAGPAFQYEIEVPSDMTVLSLAVQEQGVAANVRWSRIAPGRIAVLLHDAAAAEQSLELRGWVPCASEGQQPLPQVRMARAEAASTMVQIFRQPAVLIQVDKLTGLKELAEPGGERNASELGRPVGWYEVTAPAYAAVVSIRVNSPIAESTQVTILEREDRGNWIAEMRLQVHVSDGAIDELHFTVPENWTGPFQLDPPISHQLTDVPGESYRQLFVRPRSAIRDTFQLVMRGSWQVQPGSRPQAPILPPPNQGECDRVVVLPKELALQPVDWELRGLRPVALPDGLPARIVPTAFQAYRIIAEPADAVLRQPEPESGEPVVHLADIAIRMNAGGGQLGLARFELEPAGLTVCRLVMPTGLRLVACRVAGHTAAAVSDGPNAWRVPLSSNRLAQRIDVLFASPTPTAGPVGDTALAIPQLSDWKVLRTIYSVELPAGARLLQPLTQLPQDLLQHQSLRLQGTLELVHESARNLTGPMSAEAASWRSTWLRSLYGDWIRLESEAAARAGQGLEHPADAELQDLEVLLQQAAGRLGGVWPPASAEMPKQADLPGLWDESAAGDGLIWRTATLGTATIGTALPPVVQGLGRPARNDWLARLAMSIGVALASLICLIFTNIAPRGGHRWLWAVLAGIAWWLWLVPSIVGFVGVLVAIVLFIKHFWLSSARIQNPLDMRTQT